MEETRGTWGELQSYSYIKDRNGKTWRVDKLSADRVRLVDRDGTEVDVQRPPHSRSVAILLPTEEEARFTLAAALGAKILATRTRDGAYTCPPIAEQDLDGARWHVERFHREDCSNHTLEEILAFHEADLDVPVKHTHLEDA